MWGVVEPGILFAFLHINSVTMLWYNNKKGVLMNAIEFQTIITDSFIQIPNYKEFENKQVRVIVLDATTALPKKGHNSFIAQHIKNPVSITNNVDFLSRDEANER
jgi:hypothetical protein